MLCPKCNREMPRIIASALTDTYVCHSCNITAPQKTALGLFLKMLGDGFWLVIMLLSVVSSCTD